MMRDSAIPLTFQCFLGLDAREEMAIFNVINGKDQYKNVYVAAAADGQKEGLALIKQGGCEGRYISSGLNSPSS